MEHDKLSHLQAVPDGRDATKVKHQRCEKHTQIDPVVVVVFYFGEAVLPPDRRAQHGLHGQYEQGLHVVIGRVSGQYLVLLLHVSSLSVERAREEVDMHGLLRQRGLLVLVVFKVSCVNACIEPTEQR